jgi:hypothetical protein
MIQLPDLGSNLRISTFLLLAVNCALKSSR